MPTLRLAFTSCMDATAVPVQPVWSAIAQARPHLLLLLGDQIYMDWLLRKAPREPAAFATAMHGRYQAQWAVAEFREAMLAIRAQGGHIHLTWDDHDFAWNNAYGQPLGTDPTVNASAVPQALKDISQALFLQFQDMVQHGTSTSYPALPDLNTLPHAQGLGLRRLALGDWPVLLLDERSQRQPFGDGGASLLGEAALQALCSSVREADAGLLIVAGSSPKRHDFALGEQGWWVPPDKAHPEGPPRSYADYTALLAAARESQRPVLVLGGDIHRNAYGGPLEHNAAGMPTTSVVQVLSSGAARGHLFITEFPPSWALLELQGTPREARLRLHLNQLDDTAPASAPRELAVAAGRWAALPEGECARVLTLAERRAHLLSRLHAAPLQALVARAVNANALPAAARNAWLHDQALDTPVQPADLDHALMNKVAHVAGAPLSWPLAARLSMGESGLNLALAPPAANGAVLEGLKAAFRRAHEQAGAQPCVVLFIHGFGKSFSAAAEEATRLGTRFGVVPVLYAWPSGSSDGLLAAALSLGPAQQAASATAAALSTTLLAFAQVAADFPAVRALIVVRSLGALALQRALEVGTAANFEGMHTVQRLVLSAPLCEVREHGQWLEKLPLPSVVCINTRDETLGVAEHLWHGVASWWGGAQVLGRCGLGALRDTAPRATYLDLTRVTGVDLAHDPLMPRLSPGLARLNEQLLGPGPANAAALSALNLPGLAVSGA